MGWFDFARFEIILLAGVVHVDGHIEGNPTMASLHAGSPLTEPYYLTRSFALTRAPINPATHPCTLANEGVEAERVPHYFPGQNPFVDELTKLYGIPQESVPGGAETALPAFRKKIKDKYVRPSKCVSRECTCRALHSPLSVAWSPSCTTASGAEGVPRVARRNRAPDATTVMARRGEPHRWKV